MDFIMKIKMPKIKKTVWLKITLLVAALAVVAILLRLSSDTLHLLRYDPSLSTPQKFAMLNKWLPENVDLIAISDTHRLAAIPQLKNFLEDGLFKGDDTAIKTIRSLLGPQTKIGMIAMSAVLGDTGMPISFFVIVQGDFREVNFVDVIKQELEKENVSLASQAIGGVAIYSQGGSEAPFAFAIPDRNHLIVGTKISMQQLFEKPSSKDRTFPFVTVDSPFFGFLKSSDRIKKVLPPQFVPLELANFWADDQRWLHISIDCSDIEQAQNLRMFLSGMKALYMLQGESNQAMLEALGTVLIGGDQNKVLVDAPLEGLPAIFAE
jgi:hypothetical protein